jgi:hypothetical protein
MEVAVTGQRKTYTFLKRAKGTKRAAFLQQWAHAAPIAEDSSVARRTLNAVSYTGFVGLLFPFDGIEEAWATSEASGHHAPTRYAHLAVDEKRSLTFNAIENVIIKEQHGTSSSLRLAGSRGYRSMTTVGTGCRAASKSS